VNEYGEVQGYNHARFEGSENFLAFRSVLPVGSPAPDFRATLLDSGEPVSLSDYWKKSDVLIEFGSIT